MFSPDDWNDKCLVCCDCIAAILWCDCEQNIADAWSQDTYKFHGGLGPVLLLMLKDILKCIHHWRMDAKQHMIYHNRDTQDTPSKNILMFDWIHFYGVSVSQILQIYDLTCMHLQYVCGLCRTSNHVCLCLCSSSARVISYIILLLSCRNCVDSHLARVCHPFVIQVEGPWLFGPRDSSKINWLEMTSARICHWSARRYHKWNHKP